MLTQGLPFTPRLLKRTLAAFYVSLSATKFDQLVADGSQGPDRFCFSPPPESARGRAQGRGRATASMTRITKESPTRVMIRSRHRNILRGTLVPALLTLGPASIGGLVHASTPGHHQPAMWQLWGWSARDPGASAPIGLALVVVLAILGYRRWRTGRSRSRRTGDITPAGDHHAHDADSAGREPGADASPREHEQGIGGTP